MADGAEYVDVARLARPRLAGGAHAWSRASRVLPRGGASRQHHESAAPGGVCLAAIARQSGLPERRSGRTVALGTPYPMAPARSPRAVLHTAGGLSRVGAAHGLW